MFLMQQHSHQYRFILTFLAFDGPAYKAAEKHGISASQARNIRRGAQWRHVYDRFHAMKTAGEFG